MRIRHIPKRDLSREVRRRLSRSDVILDIGSGIRPQDFIKPKIHICCEPFGPYVSELQRISRENFWTNILVLQATWPEVVRLFPRRSVDTVFLLDVIEHLDKEEGRLLLAATIPIARKHVIVFTPLGFLEQTHPDGKDAWGFDGGSWQEHRSGWEPEDFGEDWESLVVRDFHQEDNLGRKYQIPKGAFVAIYSARPSAEKPTRIVFFEKLKVLLRSS